MKNDKLVQYVQDAKLEEKSKTNILHLFSPLFVEAQKLEESARIIVQDANQLDLIDKARSTRLELKSIRIKAEKEKTALKKDALEYGKVVQGVYNAIEYYISPMEKHLQEQENFVERIKEKEREELEQKRVVEIKKYYEYVPVNIALCTMTEDDYQKLLAGAKFQYDARIKAEGAAEKLRLEELEKEAQRQDELEKENDRLKKEAEIQSIEKAKEDAKARKEKELAEKKLADLQKEKDLAEEKASEEKATIEAEKAELERVELERVEREKAELDRVRIKKEDAEKKAEEAPDMDKIINFADKLTGLKQPECHTTNGKELLSSSYKKIMGLVLEMKSDAMKQKGA